MTAAPAPSPAEQAVIDRFGIFAEEESVDLTPGVVWTDSQLDVLRHLTAELFKARAKVDRFEAAEPAAESFRRTSLRPVGSGGRRRDTTSEGDGRG